jgi:hypothetical protein
VLQPLGESFVASASAFYSSLTDLRLPADPDSAYSGFYHGWPVAYIDFAVNEGSARTYGATLALDFAASPAPDRRVLARGALSLADGSILSHVTSLDAKRRIPIGGMSPVEARFGADIEWSRWTVAPRLAISGRQRREPRP